MPAGHNQIWMRQKWKYTQKHVTKGEKSFQQRSYKHLSLIVDGMDQKKTGIPFAFNGPKDLKDLVPYKSAVVGTIVHGFEAHAYVVEPFCTCFTFVPSAIGMTSAPISRCIKSEGYCLSKICVRGWYILIDRNFDCVREY